MANVASIDLERSSSQSLSANDSVSLSIVGDITFELWIKLEQLPSSAGGNMVLVDKDAAGNRSWDVSINSGNDKLQVYYFDAADNYTQATMDEAFVAGDVGTWIHIAVAIDVSAKTFEFYKNGVLKSDTVGTANATSIKDTTAPVTIGMTGYSTLYFDGLIDEVRVWNDIRTATEINDNKSLELVGNEAGLVAYWKLNNSLLDETANNNDLTNNNSAVFSTDVPFAGATTNASFLMFMI